MKTGPTKPMRMTFHDAFLLLLGSGEWRSHQDLLSYFALEDWEKAAISLRIMTETGELERAPGEAPVVWRYRRKASS